MGAEQFDTFVAEKDPGKAFDAAHKQAQYEHGHGGYTGTIAEKGNYVTVSDKPLTMAEAQTLVEHLMGQDVPWTEEERRTGREMGKYGDKRFQDKFGPAGAIPISLPYRVVKVKNLSGDLRDKNAAAVAALGSKVRPTEEVLSVEMHSYSTPDYARRGFAYGGYNRNPAQPFSGGTATVKVRKSPRARRSVDGWLFFGTAAY